MNLKLNQSDNNNEDFILALPGIILLTTEQLISHLPNGIHLKSFRYCLQLDTVTDAFLLGDKPKPVIQNSLKIIRTVFCDMELRYKN